MTEEALAGYVPAPDANATKVVADSSPAPEVAETTAADTGNSEEAALKTATQKRIDKLTWEKNERERELAYWRSLAMQRQEPQEPVKQPEAVTPPTLEQYGHDEAKYQLAVTEYAKSVARTEAQEAIRAERDRGKAEDRAKTFKTREAEFIAKTGDYQEKVYDPTLPMSKGMVELIAESSDGPQLAYYLANNRDVAAQLAAIPPIEDKNGNLIPHPLVALELGRIQAKFSQPKPAPVVSKAPPPPPKVDEGAEAITRISPDSSDSDKLSDQEWLRKRNAQEARKASRK